MERGEKKPLDTIKSSFTKRSKKWPTGTSETVIALHRKMMQGISLYKQTYGNDVFEKEAKMTQNEYNQYSRGHLVVCNVCQCCGRVGASPEKTGDNLYEVYCENCGLYEKDWKGPKALMYHKGDLSYVCDDSGNVSVDKLEGTGHPIDQSAATAS